MNGGRILIELEECRNLCKMYYEYSTRNVEQYHAGNYQVQREELNEEYIPASEDDLPRFFQICEILRCVELLYQHDLIAYLQRIFRQNNMIVNWGNIQYENYQINAFALYHQQRIRWDRYGYIQPDIQPHRPGDNFIRLFFITLFNINENKEGIHIAIQNPDDIFHDIMESLRHD